MYAIYTKPLQGTVYSKNYTIKLEYQLKPLKK